MPWNTLAFCAFYINYAEKHQISDIKASLQEIIDAYNKEAPAYKKVVKLNVREKEFEKTAARKIKRY